MEPIIPPQTGNAVPVAKRRRRIALVILAVVAGILYLAGNVWLFLRVRKPQPTVPVPAAIRRFYEQEKKSADTPTPMATPTPTPRPTGPGKYACSAEGDCNLYSDEARRQYCTTTYADSLCLDQCADPATRCGK
ncbi:hypothetical protein HY339_00875 [Candidatus Gottesmanbacteria bacterium]|nr:hypothetical protein [Candidatus Gottesmanbacteria bacterium]